MVEQFIQEVFLLFVVPYPHHNAQATEQVRGLVQKAQKGTNRSISKGDKGDETNPGGEGLDCQPGQSMIETFEEYADESLRQARERAGQEVPVCLHTEAVE